MKIRVAVIEDNQINIDLIRYQLEVEGFEVFIERTGGKGCLLYTSPSPRDGLLSRMPSSA